MKKNKATHVIVDVHKKDSFYPSRKYLIGKKVTDVEPTNEHNEHYPSYFATFATCFLKKKTLMKMGNSKRGLTNKFFFYAVKLKEIKE